MKNSVTIDSYEIEKFIANTLGIDFDDVTLRTNSNHEFDDEFVTVTINYISEDRIKEIIGDE